MVQVFSCYFVSNGSNLPHSKRPKSCPRSNTRIVLQNSPDKVDGAMIKIDIAHAFNVGRVVLFILFNSFVMAL